jgi:hypothetical protein
MDPMTMSYRVFDSILGKRYFNRWLESSLDALEEAALRDH